MVKLDRLGWAAGLAFTCHGARIGIRVNDPAALDHVPACLPPGSKVAAAPVVDQLYSLFVGNSRPDARFRRYHLLYAGTEQLVRTQDLDEVWPALASDLHFGVALGARRRLFVHAGVVGWRNRAIVIPGRTLSGKTSLVAALVQAGATYFSDEYAVLDGQGCVHPYPKPLSIRPAADQAGRSVSVEALGGRAATEPLPVGLIVVTHYRPGARWRPRVLSPGQALLALLDNTVLASVRPRAALATLRRAVQGAVTLKGDRGDVKTVIPLLLDRLPAAMV